MKVDWDGCDAIACRGADMRIGTCNRGVVVFWSARVFGIRLDEGAVCIVRRHVFLSVSFSLIESVHREFRGDRTLQCANWSLLGRPWWVAFYRQSRDGIAAGFSCKASAFTKNGNAAYNESVSRPPEFAGCLCLLGRVIMLLN